MKNIFRIEQDGGEIWIDLSAIATVVFGAKLVTATAGMTFSDKTPVAMVQVSSGILYRIYDEADAARLKAALQDACDFEWEDADSTLEDDLAELVGQEDRE